MTAQGLIEPAPVVRAVERFIALAVVAILAIHLFLPNRAYLFLLAGLPLLTVTAIYIKAVQPFHLSFFCTLWVFLPLLIPTLARWPLYKVVPLAVYGSVVVVNQRLRRSVLWMRPGRFGVDISLFVLLVVIGSSAALLVWDLICRPDLGPSRANIPALPLWLMPFAGLAFALVNAAAEEAIFRGILLQALDTAIGAGLISLIIQAVLFGWAHYSEVGCPKGLAGVAMASTYGLLLGFLRYRARGMLGPWVAHTGTDIAVFVMVATS